MKSIWFTGLRHGITIGIVLKNSKHGDKAFIGIGEGISKLEDEIEIFQYGVPFPVEIAKKLMERLE
jgi:hypothetical protein